MPILGNPDIQIGQINPAGAQTNLITDPDPSTGFITGDTLFNVDATQAPQGQLPPLSQEIDGIRAVGTRRGIVGLSANNIGVAGYVSEPGPIPPLPPGVTNTGVLGYSVGGPIEPGVITPAGVTGQSDLGYGVYGFSGNAGVVGAGGNVVLVGPLPNAGVFGQGGAGSPGVVGQTDSGAGVHGKSGGPNSSPFTAVGVFGETGGGDNTGVQGNGSGTAAGVSGFGDLVAGVGVFGEGGRGVLGEGTHGAGVFGLAASGNNNGVEGHGSGTSAGVAGFGDGAPNTAPGGTVGVFGVAGSGNNNGVEGHSSGKGAGVAGFGESFGVHGEGQVLGVGVSGSAPSGGTGVQATGGIGLFASGGFAAGFFDGKVVVVGDLVVSGKKSAAVRHKDGSYRLLYAVESPESWFEDFGEGRLVKGKAKVKLERAFASVIETNSFHVFLTTYGDSNGLYVSQRSKQGFEVREQGGGRASVRFSYRIVAKRKDIRGERLAKIALPKVKPTPFMSKPPVKLKQAAPPLPKPLTLPKVKAKRSMSTAAEKPKRNLGSAKRRT